VIVTVLFQSVTLWNDYKKTLSFYFIYTDILLSYHLIIIMFFILVNMIFFKNNFPV